MRVTKSAWSARLAAVLVHECLVEAAVSLSGISYA